MSALVRALGKASVQSTGAAKDYLALSKPRITGLIVLSALAGYFLALGDGAEATRLLATLLGTALVAGGANAVNQVLERDQDSRMRRTRDRPLPSGRLSLREATAFGLALSLAGTAWLAWATNLLTMLLAVLTWVAYLLAYTPMKRVTPLSTAIGAVPGALPAAAGWAAARGSLGWEAVVLFLVVYAWQMPHFLALAWMYREDYPRAGFQMLPQVDTSGRVTGRHSALFAAALVLVTLVPALRGSIGPAFGVGSLLVGGGFAGLAIRFALRRSKRRARQLFAASLIYLPAILLLMILASIAA